MRIPERVALRALQRFMVDQNGCHISTYAASGTGYATVGWSESNRNHFTGAHRAAWVGANNQQIPPGLTIDHICRVRRCVNPAHLRLRTNLDNASDNGKQHLNPITGTYLACGHMGVRSHEGRGELIYCRECQAEYARQRRAEGKVA